MVASRRFEIAELFPQPKEVILGEGISELAKDVRLSTSNVLPIQRKALRSILNLAGVRVVANKKKYVVDAQVLEESEFDLSRVPEAVRRDYYSLEIRGSEVFIRTPHQEGMVWAAQTLSSLFAMMFHGRAVPNLVIHDWPVVPLRGILAGADWGTERMDPVAWNQMLDCMSAMHLNLCGLGVYDCRPASRPFQATRPSEFLLAPLEEEGAPSSLVSRNRYRYYNVKYDRWYDREAVPALAEGEAFTEVLTYGKERGVTIFPYMELLGHSTLLPRLTPAISACDEKGRPTGQGLCLSSPAARQELEKVLESFLKRHFPTDVEFFHIGLDDLSSIPLHENDGVKDGIWCRCAKCRKAGQAALLASYLKWMVDFLTAHGVKRVLFFGEELCHGGKLLGAELEALFRDEDFASKVVVHWQGRVPAFARKGALAKVQSWYGPWMNLGNHTWFNGDLATMDASLVEVVEKHGEAALVRGQFDPGYWEQLALLGVRCWETPDAQEDTVPNLRRRWAELQWGNMAESYLELLDGLKKLAESELCRQILPTWQVEENAKDHAVPAYPESVLAALPAASVARLAKAVEESGALVEKAAALLGAAQWPTLHKASLQSILGSAQRLRIQLEFFQTLAKLKETLGKKNGTAPAKKLLETAIPQLVERMKVIEENMPDSIMWITMQHLGCLKLVLEGLQDALQRKTPADKLPWALPVNWEAPQE
ncbi:MAG: glycoside hydrolase family 20 zincin-like fold domain-containing protein [Oligosphaeraceae bacterium]